MATDVIVCFALAREARPFRRRCPGVPVFLTGVGTERARIIIEEVIAKSKPRRLILAGFGGALSLKSRVGDVIVARDVIDESNQIWKCAGDGEGRVLTVNRMIATAEEKIKLGKQFNADVCDMESSIVAEICKLNGVEFMAVRAISDTAEHSLSPTLDRLIANGTVSPQRALLALLHEPRLIMEFRRLARDTRIAALRLAEAIQSLIYWPAVHGGES